MCTDPDLPGTEIVVDDYPVVTFDSSFILGADDIVITGLQAPIYRVPKNGGAAQMIGNANSPPTALALSPVQFSWTSLDAPFVSKIPLSGGPTEILATDDTGPTLEDLATDGQDVFFVTYTLDDPPSGTPGVFRVPASGGVVTQLVSLTNGTQRVVLDETHAYYFDAGVWRVPKAGGAAEEMIAVDLKTIQDPIAVDADAVYFGGGDIVRLPKDGSASVIVAQPPPYEVIDVVVDDHDVYWSETSAGTVSRAPKTGGGPTEVMAVCVQLYDRQQFGIDETHLYWMGRDGKLKRRAK